VETEIAEKVGSRSSARADRGTGFSDRAFLILILSALLGALAVVLVLSMGIGATRIGVREVLGCLLNWHRSGDTNSVILFEIRLPRVLASAFVGAALSVAGLLFQGLFRNPMADPYVIGSSGGAALGAGIGLFLLPRFSFLGFGATAAMGFVGSVATIALVYWLARIGGRVPVVTLLLAGFAVSTMLSYSTYFLVVLDDSFGLRTRVLASWLTGVIAVPRWSQLAVTAVMIGFGLICCLPLARRLNTLALGDDYARQVGVQVEKTHLAIILTGSLITAAAVSLGGVISFVGLIVPHMARLVLGPDHTRLLPVTAIAGSIFLVLGDTMARTVLAPSEIPVGLLTAFIGGPFFLYLLRRTRREYTL
jgi:ABC-type Fe3+-siderophore transport system permease subunit